MKFLRYHLWRAAKRASLSREFKASLWNTLNVAWAAKHLPECRWYQQVLFKIGVGATTGVMAVASFGTAVYAYSNPEVTVGTALYPLKQKLEDVEEKLQRSPEDKAKFYLKRLSRREAEKVVLSQRHQNLGAVQNQIRGVEDKLEKISQLLDGTSLNDKTLRPRIQDRLRRKQENLKKREVKLESEKDSIKESTNSSSTSMLTSSSTKKHGDKSIRRGRKAAGYQKK